MQTIDQGGWIFQITDSGEAVLTECPQDGLVLTLPATVAGHPLTGIEHDAFDHAGPFEAFRVPNGHPAFAARDGVLFDRSGERLIRYPHRRAATAYTVPDSVRMIEASAFAGAEGLQRVTVPEGVARIEMYAFTDCPELTEIDLPASLSRVGHELFRGSKRLAAVHLPAGHPFLRVEDGCLVDRKENMLLVCLPGTGPQTLVTPENIRYVDDYAFYGCHKLRKIHLHRGLRTLGRYAFYHCAELTSVELPEGLRSIGVRAFSGCEQLKTLYIPDSVTSIEYKAFNNCTRLVLLVNKGSYTDRYCRQFGFPCRHRIQWPWH